MRHTSAKIFNCNEDKMSCALSLIILNKITKFYFHLFATFVTNNVPFVRHFYDVSMVTLVTEQKYVVLFDAVM